MGAIRRNSALYFVACLDSLCGIFKAFYLGLPLRMPRNSLSPQYGHTGASPLVRCRGSTAVSLSWTPQRVPPRRTSSNTCCDLVRGSLPPCGQSRGSLSTNLTLFSYGPSRRATRSWCGPPRVKYGRRFLQSDESHPVASEGLPRQGRLYTRRRFLP